MSLVRSVESGSDACHDAGGTGRVKGGQESSSAQLGEPLVIRSLLERCPAACRVGS